MTMALFGNERTDALDKRMTGVEQGLTKLSQSLVQLANTVKSSTPEALKEVLDGADRVRQLEEALNSKQSEIEELVNEIQEVNSNAKELRDKVADQATEAAKKKADIETTLGGIKSAEVEYRESLATVKEKLGTLDAAFKKYPELDKEIERLEKASESALENDKKSALSLSNINKRREEVEDLHRQVFGYTQKNEETGKDDEVPGLKDELDEAYGDLKSRIDSTQKEIGDVSEKYQSSFGDFEKEHKVKYKAISDEISQLLPGAMTAGLSSAFASKKADEVLASKGLQNRFQIGIGLMIAASLVPVIVGSIFLYKGLGWEQVLERLPRLVFTMLPLYIPVLWFTYSASKKLNLSKRLIEEYAHKEVLSRTYEGFAKQIESLADPGQSAELRFRLLSNFLMASSENPGKLISDYQASDHPVMEALEQSYKFQVAIDKLEGIPGLGKLAAKFEKKRVAKMAAKEAKVDEGLEGMQDEPEVK
ncbi:MAG: hypothetical protein LKM36_02570 [Flavobacteriales bacterium]|jgi:uncharacterized coiled-coil DUF342 family protein|nr:hypothetical protein [Flavobacteriales bacterium]